MNLVLVPLWLLSGAIFPMNSSSQWLSLIMHLNPLSYGLDWLRYVLYWNNDARTVDLLNCNLSIAVTLLFGSVMFYLSVRAVKKK
jgi:ABC-2 type transport system permease protein